MPFIHWVVEPKFVSRKELDKNVENEFETVSNNSLVAVLQQLACIVKCANRIFDQVGQDLNNIHNRSVTLTTRIKNLSETVSNLDAKKVPIPVGDLTKFSVVKEHFVSSQPVENELFLREKRPPSVQLWYDAASLSPVHIMRQIDKFREDGCRSSKYFICMPVFKDNQRKVGLDIETRRPASMCGVRKWQNEEDCEVSSLDRHSGDEIDGSLLRLPSPEERTHALSLKYPYSDVPIDVTGNSFRRMGSLRRSFLQQVEFFTRKKKKNKKSKSNRRNTISGGDEIEAALNDYDKKGESSSSMSKLRKRFSITEGARFFRENGFEHFYSSLRRPAENKGVQTGEDECEDIERVKNRLYETLNPKKQEKKSKGKSNIPISVKLRGSGSRTGAKGEDSGQSSSGNWSASSSTRTSVESENLKAAALEFARTTSQASLSKDSALSEGTTQNEDLRSNDSRIDYQSDNSVSTNASLKNGADKNFSTKDTEHWLRGLREELPSEDGTSTTGTLTPVGGKRAFSPLLFIDDEDSSVYSVDTDGYYTSMHTDSGLRSLSSSSKPVDKEGSDETEENGSTMSSISTIDQTDSGEPKSPDRTKAKKMPPMPPKRMSSLPNGSTSSETTSRPSPSSSPESDSDERSSLKKKTVINASRIPSMCIVTPNPSDDEASSNGGSLERPLRSILNGKKEESEKPSEKRIWWGEGSNTLPRSFGRNYSGEFSTHSWPRTPASQKTGKVNESAMELRSSKEESVPRLPLKYVQHITVTPGKRGVAQQEKQNAISSTEPPKITYATGSLERKTNEVIYDRPKAQGRTVPVNKWNDYSSNTLPRARVTQNGPPVPLFPNKSQDAFRPNTFQYSTLPRRTPVPENWRENPQRGPTPPSPGSDSSPRESMADLPPPMNLMSPTLSQTARRWSYTTPRMQPEDPRTPAGRPSYLPISRTPATPLYRPPPAPNTRSHYNAPPTTSTLPRYQLVPRNETPQIAQRPPQVNGRVTSPAPTSGPPTPQRRYVLNVSNLSQRIDTTSPGMTNGQSYSNLSSPTSPIANESARNGFCKTFPANYSKGDRYGVANQTKEDKRATECLKNIPKPSMSTDDLFAAIHQSKKRLNLKNDHDRSASPSSVRSESPSLFGGRSHIPRVSSPESGTLSPRCLSPGGRKSWSGDCPSPGDRKSWAMDRLGASKPTTLRDFKMLLLHAGRNNSPQTVQQRKSATEMLKVTPTKSPQPTYAKPSVTQPSTPLNGHLGIPIIDATTPPQRISPRPMNHNVFGRSRSRFPFHPHTDILSSPIWEDHMEDVDSPGSEEKHVYFARSSTPQRNGFGINPVKRALY